MSKHKILSKLLGAAAFSTAVIGAGGYWLSGNTSMGERQTMDESRKWQAKRYDLTFYDELEKTDYTIRSYDGYVLHCQFCKNPTLTDRYVIISHGHTDTHYGAVKYMKLYLDLGFNCIIYDLRGHGDNERTHCTYGLREGRDLYELIRDTKRRYGSDIRLGLHGESLGSATTVCALGYKPDVEFAVCDCGFADIENVLLGVLHSFHGPDVIYNLTSEITRLRFGNRYQEMRPIDSLPGNTVPMLFLHGEEDGFISPDNSRRMQAATSGYSELHLIPGANHAESVLVEPELYQKYVSDFISHI